VLEKQAFHTAIPGEARNSFGERKKVEAVAVEKKGGVGF